jgi:hypothetical protein
MPKRFLNVEYSECRARINITEFEHLSEVQKAIKEALAIDVAYAYIQLYNQEGRQITDLEDIPNEYYNKPNNGGLFLSIRSSPPPTRGPIRNALVTTDSSTEEDLPRK